MALALMLFSLPPAFHILYAHGRLWNAFHICMMKSKDVKDESDCQIDITTDENTSLLWTKVILNKKQYSILN